MSRAVDAVVVGAGLSGLVAAWRLVQGGATVAVIEAQDRVGGRLLTRELAGGPVDLGGQWISPTQDRIAALADELGARTAPQHRDGQMVWAPAPPVGLRDRVPLLAALETRRQIAALDELGARLAAAPAGSRERADADGTSIADWIRGRVAAPRARATLAMLAELHLGADPASVSLAGFLATLRTGGGLTGAALGRDAVERRIVGGAQTLAQRLADALRGAGAAIRLGAPVTAIAAAVGAPAVAVSAGREPWRARRVIVAVPPALAAQITTDSPFPRAYRAFGQRSVAGAVIKCAVAYEDAFWRRAGLSGEAYATHGPVRAVVDASRLPGQAPALLAFVVGDWTRRLSADPEARREAVIEALVALLGDDAATPLDYTDRDWGADPWSAGCAVALKTFNSTNKCLNTADKTSKKPEFDSFKLVQAVASPRDRVHFAGTETAGRWPGYMDGAVRAGERAAAEVLAGLGLADADADGAGPDPDPV